MTTLGGWANFYVIVGSSAGALIGLQFVVLTLIADMPMRPGVEQAGRTYSTPTIVHFASVLLLSAILTAPWRGVAGPSMLWGAGGVIGVVYALSTGRGMRAQTLYRPQFEDWLFHVLVPLAAYGTLALSAWATLYYPHEALFGVAAAALLLLFAGIHNAWDGVTYHVFNVKPKLQKRQEESSKSS